MNPGDEVLYPNPGYPIYESQIEFHGGVAVPYGFTRGQDNFEVDLDGLEKAITPRTRFLVFNNLQNPTGAESSHAELEKIAEMAVRHDLRVLCDEAYFDIRYSGSSESLASFPGMAERSVILYTFSKKYAMTGWRLGAAIGPTEWIAAIARLNVNDESCTNTFIQHGAIEALTGDQAGATALLDVLRERRDTALAILAKTPGVSCFAANSTFYLFPDVTETLYRLTGDDYDRFRLAAREATGVSFCTRLHFGRALPGEKRRYIRLAYSGIDVDQIAEGLESFREFLSK
jgi:aspartate/methionine/tyrosine aminotransferase